MTRLKALAACWKRTETAPARLARSLQALVGGPASKKVAAGAVVVGVAGIVLAAVVCARRDSGNDSAPTPGVWVAVLQLRADALLTGNRVSTIRVFDVVTGREHVVGKPALYARLAFSPAGDRLAAIDVDTSEEDQLAANVRIWTTAGHPIARVAFSGFAESPTALGWSPDGTRLAAIGAGGVTVLDSSGRRLGRAGLTPVGHSVPNIQGRPTDYWSPDSRYVAVYANGLVFIADREGVGRESDLPPALLDPIARESVGVNFYGWKGSGQVAVVSVGPAGAEEYIGVVGGPSIQWGDPTPFDVSSAMSDPQMVDQLRALVPGTGLVGEQPTADRSADVFVLRDQVGPSDVTDRITVAIRVNAEIVLVDLGAAGFPSNVRPRFDVVVVPGWSGRPPARFDAITPLIAPTPR